MDVCGGGGLGGDGGGGIGVECGGVRSRCKGVQGGEESVYGCLWGVKVLGGGKMDREGTWGRDFLKSIL